jgi:hypothetical protein
MAIYTAFPHDHPITKRIRCVICCETVSLHKATAGSLHADGSQAFACDLHIYNRGVWITAWALFDAKQEAMTHANSGMGSTV